MLVYNHSYAAYMLSFCATGIIYLTLFYCMFSGVSPAHFTNGHDIDIESVLFFMALCILPSSYKVLCFQFLGVRHCLLQGDFVC